MAVITSVEKQKKGERLNVFLDNKFAFGIDPFNLLKFKLKVGKELSEEEVSNIIKKSEFQKTLDKLLKFSMLRPRSEKEIKDYLKRKKVSEVIYDDLFRELKYFDLLDDLKFAKWWVEQRQTFRPKPKRIITQELKIKGISQEIINEVFTDTKIDELKIAKDLINKKMYKWEKYDEKTKKQKMIQFLSGKGFTWEVIDKYFTQ